MVLGRKTLMLVSDSSEGTLRFWSVATGTEVLLLEDAAAFWGCPISPNGHTVGRTQRSTNTVRLTRLEDPAQCRAW